VVEGPEKGESFLHPFLRRNLSPAIHLHALAAVAGKP
jgi:hypothetical protein